MKIIAVGNNYPNHNNDTETTLLPTEPTIFMKPDSSLLKEGKPFFIPDFTNEVIFEAELVVKIDRLGKNIAERFAHRYYSEVTVGIDFTANDWMQRLTSNGMPWELGKAFDNSAAIGRFVPIEQLGGDVNNLPFKLDKNGSTVQQTSTAEMRFKIDQIIAYVSRFVTLKIGDLIYTGTPVGAGPVAINDHLQGYVGDQMVMDFHVK